MIQILENYFHDMKRFSWIRRIRILIHIKYWYHNTPYLELPSLPHHICQILPTKTSPQHNYHYVLHRFPCFVLSIFTTHHSYWIYQTIHQANPLKFFIKIYTDQKNIWIKHATYKNSESLRAVSLSKLDSMVNSNSIFNTKSAKMAKQNGRSSLIFTTQLVHTITPIISTKNPFLLFS